MSCEQELCGNWTGDGCACGVFGIDPVCGTDQEREVARLRAQVSDLTDGGRWIKPQVAARWWDAIVTAAVRWPEWEPFYEASGRGPTDAVMVEFLQHQHERVARLRGVVQAVERLHRKINLYEECPDLNGCDSPACGEGEYEGEYWHLDVIEGEACAWCRDEDGGSIDWPCSTAVALAAVGGLPVPTDEGTQP